MPPMSERNLEKACTKHLLSESCRNFSWAFYSEALPTVNNQMVVHDVLSELLSFFPSQVAVRSWDYPLEVRSLAHRLKVAAVHLLVAVEKNYSDRWVVVYCFEAPTLDFHFERRSSRKHR